MRISRKQSWLRYCVWLAPLLVMLLATVAIADEQDIDFSLCDPKSKEQDAYTHKKTRGEINLAIGAIKAIKADGSIMWSLAGWPEDAGLEINLPSDDQESVTISGSPNKSGLINFELKATYTNEEGEVECTRPYWLDLKKPFDLVFALDFSGSMGWPSSTEEPGSGGDQSRWKIVRDAVDASAITLAKLKKDLTYAGEKDRFGLVFFPANENPEYPSGAPDAVIWPIDDNLTAEIISATMPQRPFSYNKTPMGQGLLDAENLMAQCDRQRVAVLFTDGEQNVDPRVRSDGMGYEDEAGNPLAGINSVCTKPEDQPLEIVTVGLWSPNIGELESTLQALADINGDHSYLSDNKIATNLDHVIQEALKANSPQIVTSYKGNFSEDAPPPPTFAINREVGRLVIRWSFQQDFEDSEEPYWLLDSLRITRDGADVTDYFHKSGNDVDSKYFLASTDFEHPESGSIPPEGIYSVQTDLKWDFDYRVVVFADDHRLDMDWHVSPAAPRVNEPFHPTMTLSWLGRPVENATVEVDVLKPGDDLGDLLARTDKTVVPLDPKDHPDAGSPGHQKYLELLKDDAFLQLIRAKKVPKRLEHQGGDTYSAAFDPGDVSGVYQVLYRVTAEHPDFGRVERLAKQSVYVRFGEIDLEASLVETTDDGDNSVTIDFRPITTYGRYIGPAQGGAFSVAGEGIRLNRVTDHQDGSYSLTLVGDPGAEVSVNVLGEEIYQGKASDFGPEGAGLPPWLRWLLILLVLLLVIWLIRRLARGSSSP